MTKEKPVEVQPSLPISKIFVPDNLRTKGWEKKLGELVKLIAGAGLQQPPGVVPLPVVSPGPNGETHALVYGFRRLEACKQLGWKEIPVTLLTSSSEKAIFVAQLTENFGREDLTPLEEASAYQLAIENYGFSSKELAESVGKTAGYISQRLSLLKMPDYIKTAVQKGEITPTHAREISRVTDEDEQKELLEKAKHTVLTDFKADVDSSKSKKQSARGRPLKAEKLGVGKVSTNGMRSLAEAKKTLSVIDQWKKEAYEANNRSKQDLFKGLMRGIGWSYKMVDEILPPTRKIEATKP